jgi:hypothetical protein
VVQIYFQDGHQHTRRTFARFFFFCLDHPGVHLVTGYPARAAQVRAIEDEIGLGQIEEVIEIAKDELALVDYYYENKGWELVADEKRRADKVVEAMADSINFTTQASTVPPPPPPPAPPAGAPPK